MPSWPARTPGSVRPRTVRSARVRRRRTGTLCPRLELRPAQRPDRLARRALWRHAVHRPRLRQTSRRHRTAPAG